MLSRAEHHQPFGETAIAEGIRSDPGNGRVATVEPSLPITVLENGVSNVRSRIVRILNEDVHVQTELLCFTEHPTFADSNEICVSRFINDQSHPRERLLPGASVPIGHVNDGAENNPNRVHADIPKSTTLNKQNAAVFKEAAKFPIWIG